VFGIDGIALPPDPVQQQPTYDTALAAFERLAPVRILFDNGAGSGPGKPIAGFERSFARFPIPGTRARRWYLTSGGALAARPPARPIADAFTWNPRARPLTDFSGDTGSGPHGLWTDSPVFHWRQPPAGSAASYVTAPLASDETVIGAGFVRVWLRASAPNVDLQATISEVRPDGKETFVQNGWLRADERALDPRTSTLLEPELSLRARDVSPVPRRRYVAATIPLFYEGHVYRAGSRIRVTIEAPNGDQPIWSFSQTSPRGRATVTLLSSRSRRSALVLPEVPGIAAPTPLPPCPGLRNEPCRGYVAYVNRGG
jgi:predicted acyl esterase